MEKLLRRGVVSLLLFALQMPAGWTQPAQAQQEMQPVIRTSTAEVLLDVVVRDRRGRLVRNLRPEDIEIYENGVKQQIRAFRFAGAERRTTERRGQEAARQTSATPGAAGAALPLRTVNLLCIVFHNLDPVNRTRAQRVAEQLLKEEFPPNTLAAVFALDDYLTPISPFTDQKQDLLAAVQQAFSGRTLDFLDASVPVLTANPSAYTVTALVDMAARSATINDRLTGGEVSKLVVPRAEVSMSTSANVTRGYQARDRVDMAHVTGSRALDQMATMVSELEKLPGRKSVILMSGGLLTTGDPDAFGKLVARANAANMTIYSFNPTELNETTDTQAAKIALSQVAEVSRSQTALGSVSLSERRQQSRQGDALEVAVRSSDIMAALRELAEGTGGFLVANTAEFRKPFLRVLEEMEAHYEVAYRPANLKLDGRLRTIEVKTSRKDLVVESRNGYFALPLRHSEKPLQPHELIGLALLGAEQPLAHFPFELGYYTFGGSGGRRQVAFAFEVPGKALATAQDAASGIAQAHVSVVGLVKDAEGEVVEKFSLDAPYQFALANLEAMKASAITHAQSLELAAGRYLLEVAVLDRTGARVSTKRLELEVPEPPAGLAVSTPMLVQRVEEAGAAEGSSDPLVYQGRRVVPLVSPALDPAMQPHVYFVVYPDRRKAEKAELLVEFYVNGQRLAAQTAELPPPDPSGAVPMMVSAAMRPGLCEVRITARQGEAQARSSVRYVVPQARQQSRVP
ncbi:MAG: VWA domain-containing protein [Chloroflexota bacterium]|nr:VWA domain-containing protein [Bryobacteraceae bacterium]MDW8255350.1 VWA domain-containing protein [Chloroflexota bacterium]